MKRTSKWKETKKKVLRMQKEDIGYWMPKREKNKMVRCKEKSQKSFTIAINNWGTTWTFVNPHC